MSRLLPWHVGIIIPARNEETTVEASILSVRAAIEHALPAELATITVVCDRCTDSTVQRALAAVGSTGRVLELDAGSVGEARRAGTTATLAQFRHVPFERLWLAHTDADSQVPLDWIKTQLDLAQAGWAALAGIIELQDIGTENRTGLTRAFARNYKIGSDGSHSHVHGANLGMRADAYVAAGGWRALTLSEDHCLWQRLREGGWASLSTSRLKVRTSGRLSSRAAGGFADTLRLWRDAQYVGA